MVRFRITSRLFQCLSFIRNANIFGIQRTLALVLHHNTVTRHCSNATVLIFDRENLDPKIEEWFEDKSKHVIKKAIKKLESCINGIENKKKKEKVCVNQQLF